MAFVDFKLGLSKIFRPFFLLGVGATLVACSLFSDEGYIAYSSGELGDRDISIVRPDGSSVTPILTGASDDFAPTWSPDRTQIAFLSRRDGNTEIYVAHADGSRPLRVTNTAVDESGIVWSPDSKNLAYVSPRDNASPVIYWLELLNLIPNQLLFDSISETDPDWSPNGKWIAFSGMNARDEMIGIFLRNPRGVNKVHLTQGQDQDPSWSPNGKRLAYVSELDGNKEIFIVRLNEQGVIDQTIRATANSADDYNPTWSPDGQWISFLSDRTGDVDIYRVSAEGESEQPMTTNDVAELSMSWGPQGRIVFTSELTGKADLFTMERDGGSQIQITDDDSDPRQVNW